MNTTPPPSPSVGKVLVILGAAILVLWLVSGSIAGYVFWNLYQARQAHQGYTVTASPNPMRQRPVSLKPLPDADALAARMKEKQEVYRDVRDTALAAYQKTYPAPTPHDDEARAALKLMAYLAVWGDYYGEGLWQQLAVHQDHFTATGVHLPVFELFTDIHVYEGRYTSDEAGARDLSQKAMDFNLTPYPAAFKFLVDQMAIGNVFSLRNNTNNTPPLGESLKDLPKLRDLAVAAYGDMIRAHYPNGYLYYEGTTLMDAIKDEALLKSTSAGLDSAFAVADKDNETAAALDGLFYVDYAWLARGSGTSDTVTTEGWRLMADRLASANQILTGLYAKDPNNPLVPRAMMGVVLGQEQPRDQMELWFQRGVKLNADPFRLYMAKRYYLLPRWYGSDEIVWQYGLECAATNDWAGKIPLVLIEAIDDAGSRDPGVYTSAEIWGPVEKTFRGYLDHYPDAVTWRSRFVKCAVAGGHWDVAAEQLKILGNDWDRDIFEGDEYAKTARLVATHQTGK
ncbi:MAG: hypothetical protein WDO13_12470 [Verrucomicrobiota bacterium]